jgi:hypothetical protein
MLDIYGSTEELEEFNEVVEKAKQYDALKQKYGLKEPVLTDEEKRDAGA